MMPTRILPYDARLPQLSTILNPAVMRQVFQDVLEPRDLSYRVQDVSIEWVKYKPGKNCTVCYRLRLDPHPVQTQSEQLLYGRIYGPGESESRYRKALTPELIQPPIGKAVIQIPDLEMVIWQFPNDRKLGSIPKLLNQQCLQDELLPAAIDSARGAAWTICQVAPHLVHYVPEHTCTVRVDVTVQHVTTGTHETLQLFGKTYYDDAGAQVYQSMQQLWLDHEQNGVAPEIAQPLSYLPQHRMLWQAGLPGSPLLDHAIDSPYFLNLVGQAAAAVARLHQARLTCDRVAGVETWLTTLNAMRRLLPGVNSTWKNRLDALIDELCQQGTTIPPQPTVTLHGDLHLQNILEHNGTVSLIDLDNLSQGPPGCDLGSLIAGLIYYGLITGLSEERIQQVASTFWTVYQEHAPWPLSEATLHWFIAVALINERVFRCVSRLKAGRLDIVEALIQQAEHISQGMSSPVLHSASLFSAQE